MSIITRLIAIPGIGELRAKQLISRGLKTIDDILIEPYSGMVPAEAIASVKYPTEQITWDTANDLAEFIIKCAPGSVAVGSIRRRRPFCNDVDILCCVELASILPALQKSTSAFKVMAVLANGTRRIGLLCRWRGKYVRVDLFYATHAEHAFAMVHFTGSYKHNISLRLLAKAKGLKLNQYGLHDSANNPVHCATERAVFKAIGAKWKAPAERL